MRYGSASRTTGRGCRRGARAAPRAACRRSSRSRRARCSIARRSYATRSSDRARGGSPAHRGAAARSARRRPRSAAGCGRCSRPTRSGGARECSPTATRARSPARSARRAGSGCPGRRSSAAAASRASTPTLVEEVFGYHWLPLSLYLLSYKTIGAALERFASPELMERLLPPIARGELVFCQGFSEPGAGSDLGVADDARRARGDAFVVDGHKIWTSSAQLADWIYLAVRTDPDEPKHRGHLRARRARSTRPGSRCGRFPTLGGGYALRGRSSTASRSRPRTSSASSNGGWDVLMYTLDFERITAEKLGGLAWVLDALEARLARRTGSTRVAPDRASARRARRRRGCSRSAPRTRSTAASRASAASAMAKLAGRAARCSASRGCGGRPARPRGARRRRTRRRRSKGGVGGALPRLRRLDDRGRHGRGPAARDRAARARPAMTPAARGRARRGVRAVRRRAAVRRRCSPISAPR